jgi:DNA-binding LacI/PurR family transcriptional regulator
VTTIRKVAADANVSIATVSRVLNNQTGVSDNVRSRVLESVNRCGYVANVGKRANSFLGFVYTGPQSLDSAYDSALLAGMAAAMEESPLDLVILSLFQDKQPGETYTQFFLRKGVRGVILRTTKRTRSTCEAIAAEGFPTLVIGERFDNERINFVSCDSRESTYQGVEHLIALGHERIALAISDIVQDADHQDRLEAYESALKNHQITVDRRYHFHVPPSRPDGAQVIRKMMSMSERPTAVVFTDPLVAVGALNEALRLGVRIPDDVSILGFDDSDLRNNVFPRLSAVCQDARRLGFEAFQSLARIIEEKNQSQDGGSVREVFPTWLEINETTGRPPQGVTQILPDGTRVEA